MRNAVIVDEKTVELSDDAARALLHLLNQYIDTGDALLTCPEPLAAGMRDLGDALEELHLLLLPAGPVGELRRGPAGAERLTLHGQQRGGDRGELVESVAVG